jgi:hypothetical protein
METVILILTVLFGIPMFIALAVTLSKKSPEDPKQKDRHGEGGAPFVFASGGDCSGGGDGGGGC